MSAIIWIFLALYFFAAIYFGAKNNTRSIKFLIFIILFQNIFLILFSKSMSSVQFTLCTAIKEIMLYEMALIGFLISYKKIPKHILCCILILAVVCLKNLIFSEANLWTRIVALRQILIPALCLLIGFGLLNNKNSFHKISRYVVSASVFLGVFGFIEYVLGDAFWVKIGYHEYLFLKENGASNWFYNGVTSNYYSWDIPGLVLRRMISITADPLATAHFVFLGFLISYLGLNSQVKIEGNTNSKSLSKNNGLICCFLFVCCVLSVSKAVFVLILVLIFILGFYKVKRRERWIVISLAVCLLALILIYVVLNYDSSKVSATMNHMNGLIEGFKSATLFGKGLGTAGFVSSFTNEIGVTESYIGVILVQLGWVGSLAYLLVFIILATEIYKSERLNGVRKNIFAMVMILGLMIEMLFSESSVSILGTSLFFIMIGMIYRQSILTGKKTALIPKEGSKQRATIQ